MLNRLRAIFLIDPLIVLVTAVMGSISLVAALLDSTGRSAHKVARVWARMLLRVGFVRVRVEGLENIEPDGSYVFASNHLSYMDTPVVMAHIPVQFRFLAKRPLFYVPFIGYHLKRAGHIPVHIGDARASVRTVNDTAEIIRSRGVSILVFPEGGRSPGAMESFKEGAAYFAIKAGVPAVPVGLVGTREVLPMDTLLVRGGDVVLRIGKPIPTEGMTARDREQLTAQLRERVVEMTQGCY